MGKTWEDVNNGINYRINNYQKNQLNTHITFQALQDDDQIALNQYGSPAAIELYYSINDQQEQLYTISSTTITLLSGDTVSFRNNKRSFSSNNNYYYFSTSKNTNVYGNIMSLVENGRPLATLLNIENQYQFNRLFINCNKLIDASNLLLPATTLTNACYIAMFSNCSSLSACPQFPYHQYAPWYCFNNMYNGCKSLLKAPDLPALRTHNGSYSDMFR